MKPAEKVEPPKQKTSKPIVLQNEVQKLQDCDAEKHVGVEETLKNSDLPENVLEVLLNPVTNSTPTKEELRRQKAENTARQLNQLEDYIGIKTEVSARDIQLKIKTENAEETKQLMFLFIYKTRDANKKPRYQYVEELNANKTISAKLVYVGAPMSVTM